MRSRLSIPVVLVFMAMAHASHAQIPQVFNCGTSETGQLLTSGIETHTDPYVEARIVFVSFPGFTSTLPTWTESFRTDLQDVTYLQSRGAQTLNALVVTPPGSPTSAWVAQNASTYYAQLPGGYATLNTEILTAIANAIPGVWNGVEKVFMLHYQCTFACTDPSSAQSCEETCPYGGVAGGMSGGGFSNTGTTQRFYYPLVDELVNEQAAKWIADHEYGHLLLHTPLHVPGTQYAKSSPEYVNPGRYCVMHASASGINQEGSGALHAEWHNTLNWVPRSIISTDTEGVRVPDMRSANAQIVRVNISGSTQYFECANYQGGNPFDNKYLGTGLLFTHVIPGVAWDIESAAGKFTGGNPDPVSGKDPLEANSSHYGSAADFFDGWTKTIFNPGTNPNTNRYSSNLYSSPQSVKTSIAFENIREDINGDMLVDVYLTPKQKVTRPNGAEVVPKGLPYTINWNLRPATALITTVDIELSSNGGGSWTPLATGLANSGSYSWTPATAGTQFRVRVVSHDQAGGTGIDASDANFTVEDPSVWQALTTTHPAGGRSEHGMIYDALRSRMIMFGGRNLSQNFGDVTVKPLLGTAPWQTLTTSGSGPSARYNPAVVYDAPRDRMLVFGGRSSGFTTLSNTFALTLSGTPTWSSLPTIPYPNFGADRFGVYDPVRDRLVVVDPDVGVFALTLAGTPAWSQLTSTLPIDIGQMGYSLVYDSARDRMVIFGGWTPSNNPYIYFNGVNEFSFATNTWTQLTTTNNPHPRSHGAAVYDPLRSRMVLVGGYYFQTGNHYYLNDTWVLPLGTTPTWTQLTPNGTPPSQRKGHSGVYDSNDDALVVFGGQTGASSFAEDVHALVFPDIRPPAAITSVTAEAGRWDAAVTWTLPGDDGMFGQAAQYDLRYSSAPITEANFSSASSITGQVYDPAGTQVCTWIYPLTQCMTHYFAVKHRDEAGNWSGISNVASASTACSGYFIIDCGVFSSRSPRNGEIPIALGLALPAPNPANQSTTFQYDVPPDLAGMPLELAVFDVAGRRLRTIESGAASPGRFAVAWDLRSEGGSLAAPGLYFARLVVGERRMTRTLLIR